MQEGITIKEKTYWMLKTTIGVDSKKFNEDENYNKKCKHLERN